MERVVKHWLGIPGRFGVPIPAGIQGTPGGALSALGWGQGGHGTQAGLDASEVFSSLSDSVIPPGERCHDMATPATLHTGAGLTAWTASPQTKTGHGKIMESQTGIPKWKRPLLPGSSSPCQGQGHLPAAQVAQQCSTAGASRANTCISNDSAFPAVVA